MNNSGWRVIGGLLTVAILGVGVYAGYRWLRPAAEVQIETQQQDYPQKVTRVVFTDFENSDIVVEGGAGNEGVALRRDLRWTYDKPHFTETWSGDTLHIRHNCDSSSADDVCSIRYTLRVPSTVAVEASTSSGDVTLRDLTGAARLSTVSGDIALTAVTGELTANVVSGDIRATGLGSAVAEVKSTSGDVDLTFSTAPQRVRVETTSGEAGLRVPGDYQVKVNTVSGDRDVTVPHTASAARTIDVQTVSGDVTIVSL